MLKIVVFLLISVLFSSYGCKEKAKRDQTSVQHNVDVEFSCPKEDAVKGVIQKFATDSEIQIEKIQKFKDVNLCEVEFRIGVKPAIFYVNRDLSLLFPAVIDGNTGENMALKSISQRNNIPADILKKFGDYVDFKIGDGNRYVYFITDPDCKICEASYRTLEKWSKDNKVQIRIILRPLPIHPQAYNISKSVLCANKTFEDALKGYDDKKHCDKGQQKLDKTIDFINKKMAMSDMTNPVLISDKGKILNAIPTKDNLKWLME